MVLYGDLQKVRAFSSWLLSPTQHRATHKVLYSEASKNQDYFPYLHSHGHGVSTHSPTPYSYSPTPLSTLPLFLQS